MWNSNLNMNKGSIVLCSSLLGSIALWAKKLKSLNIFTFERFCGITVPRVSDIVDFISNFDFLV